MGRDAAKAAGNPWYEARLEASKYDDRLRSREGAAELLGMSVSAVADAELGLSKVMPVDKAVIMADRYNAPHLLNLYCAHECPIGQNMPISTEVGSLEQITLKLVRQLRKEQVELVKDKLVQIAEDGEVSEEELPDLEEIINYFDALLITMCELRTLTRTLLVRKKIGGMSLTQCN